MGDVYQAAISFRTGLLRRQKVQGNLASACHADPEYCQAKKIGSYQTLRKACRYGQGSLHTCELRRICRARDGKSQKRQSYSITCFPGSRPKEAMHDVLGSIALDSGAPLHGQSQRFWQRRRHALARQMWNILDNATGRHPHLL